MFKFGITLCVVFIFFYTVDARTKVLEVSKQRYDNEILSWINDTAKLYENAQTDCAKILQSILIKLRHYRITKPAEIIAVSEKKLNEADAIIDAVTSINPVDCLDPISEFDVMTENVTHIMKECVNTQLGAVDESIMKLNRTMSKLFKELEDYRDRVDKCHSDKFNGRNLMIIRCLKPIRRELKRLETLDTSSMIRDYNNWLKHFDSTMEACTSKSLKIFNGQSRILIDTVKNCIQTKIDSMEIPFPEE